MAFRAADRLVSRSRSKGLGVAFEERPAARGRAVTVVGDDGGRETFPSWRLARIYARHRAAIRSALADRGRG